MPKSQRKELSPLGLGITAALSVLTVIGSISYYFYNKRIDPEDALERVMAYCKHSPCIVGSWISHIPQDLPGRFSNLEVYHGAIQIKDSTDDSVLNYHFTVDTHTGRICSFQLTAVEASENNTTLLTKNKKS
ncbi:hypothetical protein [Atopobacter phocae]|uniref:hypothetical protein n=1 Tax=Atopobacter phocae TaxID=136492 RepID=UPI000470B895|nr:hypothetical protein [Atopobacter phocae]